MASTSKGGDRKSQRRGVPEAGEGGRTAGRLDVETDSRMGVDGPSSDRGVRVEEVMSTEVVTVAPGATVAEAARLMRDNDVGFIPICDSEGSVVGVVTDRDLVLRALAEDKPSSAPVEDVMSEDVAFCHAGDDLGECERLMRGNLVSRMVVLGDDDALVGVVSLADLANHDEDDQRLGNLLADVKTSELTR